MHSSLDTPSAGLERLLDVAAALSRAVTALDVKRLLLEEAMHVTGAYGGAMVKVVDEDTLVLVASLGYNQSFEQTWQQLPLDEPLPLLDAIERRQPVYTTLSDLQQNYPALLPRLQANTRAVMSVPLTSGERVLSVLILSFEDERHLTSDQQTQLSLLVQHGAQALERARLYDAQHQARQRAALLAEVSTVLASTLDLQQTLQRIATLAIEHVADWAAVYQPDDSGRTRAVAVAHEDPRKVNLLRTFLERFPSDPMVYGTSAWVLRTGEDILIPAVPPATIDAFPSEEQREAIRELGFHSLILVPLTTRGQRVGVLGIATSHSSRTFGPDDLDLARELAQLASTALRNAELHASLRVSEQRYRSLVEATSQIVWTRSPEGKFVTDQPKWREFTGQTRDELLGHGWFDAVHPDDRDVAKKRWQQVVAQSTKPEIEYRLRRYDGTYRLMRASAVAVRDDDGSVREWVGVHTDITEQVMAERQLRESARQFQRLLDVNPVGVMYGRAEGTLPYANDAYLRLIGVNRETFEAGGLNWRDLTPPEWRAADEHARAQTMERGVSEPYEKEYQLPDGRRLPVQVGLARVEQDTIVAYVLDLSDRKAVERGLNDQNAHLQAFNRQLLESAGEGIFGVDPEGRTTFANPTALRLIGFTLEEVLGEPLHDLIHHHRADGSHFPIHECPIFDTVQAGTVQVVDDDLFWRKDGTSFPVEYTATPLRGACGEIEGVVVTFRDVTQRKQAEAELRVANEELRRSNAELEQFAYVASHDLQAPLRAVTSFTQLLSKRLDDQLDERAREIMQHILDGSQRMKVLIDDLLGFSRASRMQQEFRPVWSELVLQQALLNLREELDTAGAQVTHDELPVVSGNFQSLVQVFQNLIGNAVKYARPGVPPQVRISARHDGACWQFSVRDNGIGIDEQFFEKIFLVFQRLHRQDQVEGTGIGLAVCKRIVERHDGRLWVESTVGQGSTFHFTLPGA